MPTLAAGDHAPVFDLETAERSKFSLEDALARGPLIAVFLKVACPTCQYTLPFIERLHRQFGTGKIAIVGVSQDDADHTRKFAAQYGISFPLLIDPEPYKVSRAYKLKYTPTLFLISPDRTVEIASEGFAKRDLTEIQKTLATRLGAAPQPLFLPTERIPEYKPG